MGAQKVTLGHDVIIGFAELLGHGIPGPGQDKTGHDEDLMGFCRPTAVLFHETHASRGRGSSEPVK